jgi:hypothetical protein
MNEDGTIVVAYELINNSSEVSFLDRDQLVGTLPADGGDQPFAECVACWRSRRSLQDPNAEAFQFGVEASRKDPVTVTDQKAVSVVRGEKLAELLNGPVGG